MKDPAGNPFGDRSRIEMDVQTPELPPSPSYCTNGALFLADLTYEDNPAQGIVPVVSPGQRIYKAWLLKNTGTCHWDEGHRLVYAGGAALAWESPYVPPTLKSMTRGCAYWRSRTGVGVPLRAAHSQREQGGSAGHPLCPHRPGGV